MFQIDKYKTVTGECPIDDFINELRNDGQKKEIVKIISYIKLLEELGDKVLENANWAKKIDDNIFELRPKSNRVLYFMCASNNRYVLLHCFKKKTQKTPPSEIEKANKEAADYERRVLNGK